MAGLRAINGHVVWVLHTFSQLCPSFTIPVIVTTFGTCFKEK